MYAHLQSTKVARSASDMFDSYDDSIPLLCTRLYSHPQGLCNADTIIREQYQSSFLLLDAICDASSNIVVHRISW
jgi:hypothetical protein